MANSFRAIDGLQGQHVVFTGHFDTHRHKVEHDAREAGVTVSNRVTRNTTLLVLGRPNTLYKFEGYGTKIAAARSIEPRTFLAEIDADTFQRLASGETVEVVSRERALISSFGVPAVIPRAPSSSRRPTTASVLGDEFDRATRAHHDAFVEICERFLAQGWVPLTPGTGMPAYDLAVERKRKKFVIEIKSIRSGVNEVEQVRLGVGQVLHYIGQILAASDLTKAKVVPVVATSEPASEELVQAFRHHGVTLCHPGNIVKAIDKLS